MGSMLEIASKYAQANDDARDGEGPADLAIARRTSTKRKAPQEAEHPMRLMPPLRVKAATASGRPKARTRLRPKLA